MEGSRTTLRLGPTSKLTRLESGARTLIRPGATVIFKRAGQPDQSANVLVLSQP